MKENWPLQEQTQQTREQDFNSRHPDSFSSTSAAKLGQGHSRPIGMKVNPNDLQLAVSVQQIIRHCFTWQQEDEASNGSIPRSANHDYHFGIDTYPRLGIIPPGDSGGTGERFRWFQLDSGGNGR